MNKLPYLSQDVADSLRENIANNLDLYKSSEGFAEHAEAPNWNLKLSIDGDLEALQDLVCSDDPKYDYHNSLIIGKTLRNLTPVLARENRFWSRLSHLEGFKYSKKRWLKDSSSDEVLIKSIDTHFFATGIQACRDDHALSRLWWNYHIAKQTMPDEPERALKTLIASQEIRQGIVERSSLAARPIVTKAVVLTIENNEVLKRESIFRAFMRELNLLGAGIVFEVLSEEEILKRMHDCLELALEQQPKDPHS